MTSLAAGPTTLPTSPPPTIANAPRPFVKWVGGKRSLVPLYETIFPTAADLRSGYREAFVGGGAMFFELYRDVRPTILADDNPRLINCYVTVRDHLPLLLATLASFQNQFDACKSWEDFRVTYMRIRKHEPNGTGPVEVARAAWLIAINRTCMNGLYRENSRGVFNVGPGKWGRDGEPFRMPRIFDEHRLTACSRTLQGVRIVKSDFAAIVATAKRGEFVYLDPPYLPASATANFTSYTKRGFGLDAHQRLVDAVADAATRGVLVAISNSDTPMSRTLYSHSRFKVYSFEARRNVNSKATARGPVKEILVTTF